MQLLWWNYFKFNQTMQTHSAHNINQNVDWITWASQKGSGSSRPVLMTTKFSKSRCRTNLIIRTTLCSNPWSKKHQPYSQKFNQKPYILPGKYQSFHSPLHLKSLFCFVHYKLFTTSNIFIRNHVIFRFHYGWSSIQLEPPPEWVPVLCFPNVNKLLNIRASLTS